jgi:hypothetical protein
MPLFSFMYYSMLYVTYKVQLSDISRSTIQSSIYLTYFSRPYPVFLIILHSKLIAIRVPRSGFDPGACRITGRLTSIVAPPRLFTYLRRPRILNCFNNFRVSTYIENINNTKNTDRKNQTSRRSNTKLDLALKL